MNPSLMTGFFFILGVVPLLIATGAGFEMRRVFGTAVFGGMLGVTLFGLFLTPVFYVVLRGFAQHQTPAKDQSNDFSIEEANFATSLKSDDEIKGSVLSLTETIQNSDISANVVTLNLCVGATTATEISAITTDTSPSSPMKEAKSVSPIERNFKGNSNLDDLNSIANVKVPEQS